MSQEPGIDGTPADHADTQTHGADAIDGGSPQASAAGMFSGQVLPMESAGPQSERYPSLATSDEVDLNYRFGGLLVDYLVALPLYLLTVATSYKILGASLNCIYWLSRDAILGGQSLGKRVAKERVVRLDGAAFTFKGSVLRNITFLPLFSISISLTLRLMPEIEWATRPALGFLWLAETLCVVTSKRRIGDYIARTKVVRAEG